MAAAACFAAPASALPDGRAYELVSPPEKYGHSVSANAVLSSPDGDAVTYTSYGAFGDVEGAPLIMQYLSRRGGTSWGTDGLTPKQPVDLYGGASPNLGARYQAFSADLRHAALSNNRPLTADAPPYGVRVLYTRDLDSGSYRLVSVPLAPLPPSPAAPNPAFAAATPDFGHVLFESTANLAGGATGSASKLYEWIDGTVRLAGILPTGSPAPSSVAGLGATGGSAGFQGHYTQGTMSADGSRVFFSAPATNGQLYVRENGTTTRQISLSRDGTVDPNGDKPAMFQGASADGSVVYFTSKKKLTSDATTGPTDTGTDLYRYDVGHDTLTDVTADPNPSHADGAQVLGVLGVSADGAYVYFAASRALASGATDYATSIYVWHGDATGGTTRFVGTVGASDNTHPWSTDPTAIVARTSRVTPDGRRLLFVSSANQSRIGYDSAGHDEVYLYDAPSDTLRCASCDPGGSPPAGDATVITAQGVNQSRSTLGRNLSDDGRRVFFETAEPLDPDDSNGTTDVYEYDAVSGRAALISSGRGPAAYFADASSSGDDVFFVTDERLVGWDQDAGADLYDARVGGGLPEPSPMRDRCSEDACQGAPTPPAPPLVAGTTASAGSASPAPAAGPATYAIAKVGSSARARFARTGMVTLSIRVSQAGVLSARASARVGTHTRTVGSARRTLSKPGTARLALKLTAQARRQLARTRRLNVTVTVRYSRAKTPKRVTVALRTPTNSKGKR